MTSDIFYAVLKLVSGEEILAKVCAFIENDEVMIVLDNPILVNILIKSNSKVPMIKVVPWCPLSNETTFIINRKSIISMSEVKDLSLAQVHYQYTTDIQTASSSQITLNPKMSPNNSYVSTVEEARTTLEKIYQSNQSPKNLD